jgi:hypothetical protein
MENPHPDEFILAEGGTTALRVALDLLDGFLDVLQTQAVISHSGTAS